MDGSVFFVRLGAVTSHKGQTTSRTAYPRPIPLHCTSVLGCPAGLVDVLLAKLHGYLTQFAVGFVEWLGWCDRAGSILFVNFSNIEMVFHLV
jgi:hypothetical protein